MGFQKVIFKVSAIVMIAAMVFGLMPTGVQAVSANIVISQVYGGGGNSGATFKNDFIELYNLGTTRSM